MITNKEFLEWWDTVKPAADHIDLTPQQLAYMAWNRAYDFGYMDGHDDANSAWWETH